MRSYLSRRDHITYEHDVSAREGKQRNGLRRVHSSLHLLLPYKEHGILIGRRIS